MAASANRLESPNLMNHVPTPAQMEQHRLDRLFELRAVIESLRCEQAGKDPLLAWVIEQERNEAP
jgi:hypothetical protein